MKEGEGETHMVSSCLLTSLMSSKSVMSCLTMDPYVSVKISAFCKAMWQSKSDKAAAMKVG